MLTVINCRLHEGVRGMYWFPVYNLCAFVGAVLIALRGYIPDFVSIVFGMMLFHVAYLCLYRCLVDFFDGGSIRWPMRIQIVGVCVSFAASLRYGVLHPETHKRLIVYSLVFTLQLVFSAELTFRKAKAHLRVPGILMGIVLAALALNNFIRAVDTGITGAPANYLNGGAMLQWVLLSTSVLQGGIAVAFVWMTAAVLHEDMRRLASTDSLTGLLNRRAIETAAQTETALSLANGVPLAAILVDIDRFKIINDTFGHRFGDLALTQVALCLQENIRTIDLVGRVGGDEFAIVLRNTEWESAMTIAERLRASLASLLVDDGEFQTGIRASVGLARLDASIRDWDELVLRCDRALYSVKESGGNLVATC